VLLSHTALTHAHVPIERVRKLLAVCPFERCAGGGAGAGALGLSSDAAAVVSFLNAALKWAAATPEGQAAAALLHDAVGTYLWQVAGPAGLAAALTHFVRGAQVEPLAAVLRAAAPAGERDLFTLRAALLLAAAGDLTRALALPGALCPCDLQPGGPVDGFTVLYLTALGRDSQVLAQALRARYERCLAVDPSLELLLDAAEAATWPSAAPSGGAQGRGGFASLLAALAA